MFNVNDIKNGMTVEDEGNIFQVLDFSHVKPGKGAAFVKMKLKNLRTGAIVEKTYNSSVKLAQAHIQRKPMQYLYQAGDNYSFMDMQTYEQVELSKEQIGDDIKFLKENLSVDMIYYGDELIGLNLPEKIDYVVSATEQAVKGNTSSGAQKDATLENGMTIKVPLFINEGESVLVSTKDGKYVSRA
ncbi:MAG TPA: elongation factor P [Candidatus Aphodocola excrementigallinarum]|uniref:Elongation factor P n=1 Tax=Candidatus Aphodocola excrementigallinarum TaxID=2840670 RepID=A0A9D1IQL2_9FIRM|nr:elongation factor P [Candidatus Aphodocola excrementigallinarum]